MNPRIYLDNNATTFLDPRVKEAFAYYLEAFQGNPSSIHSYGQEARRLLNQARREIADYLQVKSNEVVFTSGGTEGLNMILRGIFAQNPKGHLITSSVEHSAVYETAKVLQSWGYKVSFLDPGLWGAVTSEAVKEALRPDTALIALMAVNNETGVKTDIASMAALAHEFKVPLLIDGVALLGKENFEIPLGVSAMCFSGHKLHAPKGVGFSYIRSTLKFQSIITGGEQEFGKRGGTENVPGIMGLLKAINLLKEELPQASRHMQKLRDKLEAKLISELRGVWVNGRAPRICNTSNLSFDGIEGETLLSLLDLEGVAVSHGSACASGALEPSRILLNMGLSKEKASSAIRISLSRFTTEAEIDRVADILCRLVTKLRQA